LQWWHDRCIEWCYDRVEDGRFGDQGYLNDWPTRFAGVHVLEHKGAGLAPWNWMQYQIVIGPNGITVDGVPLLFYHYQGVKLLNRTLYEPGLLQYKRVMTASLHNQLYTSYIRALLGTWTWADKAAGSVDIGYSRGRTAGVLSWIVLARRFTQGGVCFMPKN
jgi:hypothetical protein